MKNYLHLSTSIALLMMAIILLANEKVTGQAILYEDFNYATPSFIGGNTGSTGSNSNNWTTHSVTSGQTTTIDINDNSLSYNGLISSIGNKVYLFSNANATSRDVNRAFTSTATTLYYSALVNIIDNSQITATGDYFMHFGATAGTGSGNQGGRLGAKSVNSGSNFRFVIQNHSGGTPNFTDNGTDLNFGTTYFIVVKFDRSITPTLAYLWVDPISFGGAEPTGSVTNNSGTTAYPSFGSICLRNSNTTPKAYIDEIRVGTTWADVTPAGIISPSISVNPASLLELNYIYNNGPSAQQNFTISGSNLTGDITITPPADYEISTETGASFSPTNPLTLTQTGGTVGETTIYVRLKAGLAIGDYSEDITVTSTGVADQTVFCSGSVYNQIDWCNLQWPPNGTIFIGDVFNVYAQVNEQGVTSAPGQGADILGFIGYSITDTDPSTWTNWVPATFNGDAGNNDEYVVNLGTAIPSAGTYYYASLFQLGFSPYVYGGTGGFWVPGTSGVLTVNPATTPVNVTFQVNMAEQTVSPNGVHLAGSFPTHFWDPAGIEMLDPDNDEIYTVTLSLNSGVEYQFKYVNGSDWGSAELIPAACEALGTDNRYEVIGTADYSIPPVCFGSCTDCGATINLDVIFQVDMRNETVSGDGVYLAGSFTGWGGGAILMTATGTVWSTTVSLPPGLTQEFKFVNGNPNSGGQWESFDGPCLANSWGNRLMAALVANTTLDLVCFNSCMACPVADFVLINEVDSDTPGTDVAEFIELYDGGIGTTSLTGLVVVLYNGSNDLSYAAYDLDGKTTDANGYFVLGNTGVSGVGLTIAAGTLQNGQDAVALYVGDATSFPNNTAVTVSNLIDALVYDTDDVDDPGLLVLLNPGQQQVNENGKANSATHSNQRIPNGSGGPRNTSTYDQTYPTPNAPNAILALTWTGATSSDWAVNTNWSPNFVPDAGTNAIIPDVASDPVISANASCKDLTINAGALFTVNSGASLITTGTVTGSAIVKRDIGAGEWHLISSPVAGVQSGIFTGQYLQSHNEQTNAYTDITSTTVVLNNMQGYALWPDVNPFTASFAGTLNSGNQSFSATKNGAGWNLTGNPYPSSINWDLVTIPSGLNNAIYKHINASTWATYAGGVGTPTNNEKYIAPCQGFFVEATAATTLAFNNSVRVHNAATFYKSGEEAVGNMVRLEVSGNNYMDQAVVRFLPEATAEFDGAYDAHKLFGDVPEAAQIYTTGSSELAINTLPETSVVPLGVHGISGTYTIAATEINDLNDVTLEDTKTGIYTELAKNSYTFNFTTGENEKRFKLHFSALGIDDKMETAASVYSYQKTVYINLNENVTGDIFIYNIAGQLVTSKPSAVGMNEIKLSNTGNYIVKVISKESPVVTKVYIQ